MMRRGGPAGGGADSRKPLAVAGAKRSARRLLEHAADERDAEPSRRASADRRCREKPGHRQFAASLGRRHDRAPARSAGSRSAGASCRAGTATAVGESGSRSCAAANGPCRSGSTLGEGEPGADRHERCRPPNGSRRSLRPWRVEVVRGTSRRPRDRLFEPLVEASRLPRPGFRVPLYGPPADLATRTPYWTRRSSTPSPAAQRSAARQRDRLGARPARCAPAPGAGLGPARVRRRADGRRRRWSASAFAAHNDSRTSRSAAG